MSSCTLPERGRGRWQMQATREPSVVNARGTRPEVGGGAEATADSSAGLTCPPKRVATRISVLRSDWRSDEAKPVHGSAGHRDPEGRRGWREDIGPGPEAR